MIIYVDQDGQHELTEAEAIAMAKRVAAQKGHEYPNDREALVDFMVIHWAWTKPSEDMQRATGAAVGTMSNTTAPKSLKNDPEPK